MEINGAAQLGEVMVKEDEWTCPVCKKTYRARRLSRKTRRNCAGCRMVFSSCANFPLQRQDESLHILSVFLGSIPIRETSSYTDAQDNFPDDENINITERSTPGYL